MTAQLRKVTTKRSGEIGAAPLRTDRFFAVNAEWYFTTREGASIGPFGSKPDAQSGLSDFVEFITLAEPHTRSTLSTSLHSN
jgi:hypothetical protein